MSATVTESVREGVLFIVSGPSGAGKTSMSAAARERCPELEQSVSLTTRAPRGDERDGVEYRFVDRATFENLREQGELAEWAQVHDHFYGTPRAPIERAMAEGRDILLDIDVQGARQLKNLYGDRAVAIFLLPPDRDALEARLRGRATDDDDTVARRLRNACAEIASLVDYDYVIVNRDLDRARREFLAVLDAEPLRVRRLREASRAALVASFTEEGS